MPFFRDLTWLFTTSSTGCGLVFIDKYLVYIRTICNFESRRIVVSKVRHLWNYLIAELDSRNESSSLAKIGTFDDSCIAFHSRVRCKSADRDVRGTWQRSTIYQGKYSRTAQMAVFTKIQRKFHCLQILRSLSIGVKQLSINSKASLLEFSLMSQHFYMSKCS